MRSVRVACTTSQAGEQFPANPGNQAFKSNQPDTILVQLSSNESAEDLNASEDKGLWQTMDQCFPESLLSAVDIVYRAHTF